jgi:drug/metabolite transporter (DMT)-like permease
MVSEIALYSSHASAKNRGMNTSHGTPAHPLASLAPLAAIAIWTGNTLVTKAAAGLIAPASITLYRWALAFLVLTPFVAREAWRHRAVVARRWHQLAVLGCLASAVYQGLAYEAAKTTTAMNMGVIVAMMPLFSALLARTVTHEALSVRQVSGTLVSAAGIVYLITHGRPGALLSGQAHVGDALMLVAVFSNAIYGVLLRRWAIPLGTWTQLYVQIGFGTLLVLPFWLASDISPLTRANAPLVLYAALPASIGAPFFWMTGMRLLGPARTTLYMNLLPVLVALCAWLWLGEQPQAYHLVGGLAALAGVMLGSRLSG